jgi:hypothetical protein
LIREDLIRGETWAGLQLLIPPLRTDPLGARIGSTLRQHSGFHRSWHWTVDSLSDAIFDPPGPRAGVPPPNHLISDSLKTVRVLSRILVVFRVKSLKSDGGRRAKTIAIWPTRPQHWLGIRQARRDHGFRKTLDRLGHLAAPGRWPSVVRVASVCSPPAKQRAALAGRAADDLEVAGQEVAEEGRLQGGLMPAEPVEGIEAEDEALAGGLSPDADRAGGGVGESELAEGEARGQGRDRRREPSISSSRVTSPSSRR